MTETLQSLCSYVKDRAEVGAIDPMTYVSTENMVPNNGGVVAPASVPATGKVTLYKRGDTLVSNIRPYFKKIWQATEDGGCSNDVLVFRPNEQCDHDYLYWVLSSNGFFSYVSATAKGTKMPRGDKNAIMRYEVPANDKERQLAIVAALSPLRQKLILNTRINGYLLEMANGIYRQWFVGDTAKYPTTTMKLSDIATINAGGDKPKDVSQTIQPGFCVPIYSNGTDNEGLYGFTSVAKINEPSVTVSARGTIGFTCLRRRPYYPIVRLISATPKRCVTAEYLYLWLLNTSVVGVGTTQQQLTVPMFKAYDIKVPEAKAMEQFSQTISPLFDAIDSNKEECVKLAALRDVLLPRLMSGEIDVQKVAIGCGLLH
jgi:type I restriction enzyme S subunit